MNISVIVATYNSGKTLESCLLSLIYNKTESTEIIIVDGASTDNTLDIVKKYYDSIDCFITEQDNGIYDAWNKGLRVCNGAWVMFVGSDDQLCSGTITKLERFISGKVNLDYVSGRVQLMTPDQKKLQVVGDKYDWNVFRSHMNVAHVGSIHHKSLYQKYGYYDTSFKICGDYEFFLRVKDKLNASFINHTVANMTIGGVSYCTKAGLVEARDAKLKHKTKKTFIIFIDYYFSVSKWAVKKILRLI